MFKRRNKRHILEHIREAIWPSMGYARAFTYIKHRLVRLQDSTHSIALGLAIGTAVSFSPLIGTHIIQGMILALLLRGSIVASVIGTIAGNPWTFPFIWYGGFSFGTYIFELMDWNNGGALPEHIDLITIIDMAKTNPMDVFLPWMVGGYTLCFAILLPAYYFYYKLVKGGRLAQVKILEKRARHKKQTRHTK